MCPCMAWVTRGSARLQFFREALSLSFSTFYSLSFARSRFHSFIPIRFLPLAIFRLSGCQFFLSPPNTLTHTHTPLELNQKSMLSMASQYLIKQSPCPSWQVMHFTVLTHTHTHSDSLSLLHATHCNNLWKCGGARFLSQVAVEFGHSTSKER